LNQSFTDFEVIVVDDGSTDGGGDLVLTLYGSKISLIRQPNQGVSTARNIGIRHANYDYVAFLDADDLWHKDFLLWMDLLLKKFPGTGMLGSSYSRVELFEKIENPSISVIEDFFIQADYNTLFTSSSTVLHKSFFEKREGFKSNLTIGEDIDVWLRAFDWFKKACYVHAPLMFYDVKASGSLRVKPKLEQTIITEMYKDGYEISDHFPSWWTFRDKYVILNLFLYFDSVDNFSSGKKILGQRRNSYFFGIIPYLLPFSFFRFILKHSRLKKLFRNYLKFCFRYIYK